MRSTLRLLKYQECTTAPKQASWSVKSLIGESSDSTIITDEMVIVYLPHLHDHNKDTTNDTLHSWIILIKLSKLAWMAHLNVGKESPLGEMARSDIERILRCSSVMRVRMNHHSIRDIAPPSLLVGA
jgi:hypothetical protein